MGPLARPPGGRTQLPREERGLNSTRARQRDEVTTVPQIRPRYIHPRARKTAWISTRLVGWLVG
eukprot:11161425-Lingulodinium_polyedra.AAC.1